MASSSFAALLRRGSLTHLEWLELCASRLDADGVVFAQADFPRTDGEYAAQVKKVAVDLGIVPLALEVPGLLDPDVPDEDRARGRCAGDRRRRSLAPGDGRSARRSAARNVCADGRSDQGVRLGRERPPTSR